MISKAKSLFLDIENIKKIPIVPSMLEVICRSTGMGFAAIARVTQDRWIACSVRDEILFGLEPGGELQIETTICNEIRDTKQSVVIDDVSKNEHFHNHHTPRLYGFQSYISVPIILKTGEFFGTLCAIDPKPALLNNTKTIGMFTMFAELISFHLQSIHLIEQSNEALFNMNRQLSYFRDENRQFRYISNHNLQEPLRKIRVFSSMLANATNLKNPGKVQEIAQKLDSCAQGFSMMISDLSEFSELNEGAILDEVDLNKTVADVVTQLAPQFQQKNVTIEVGTMPMMRASSVQMEQLFYHLIDNAIRYSKNEIAPEIRIFTSQPEFNPLSAGKAFQLIEINVQDNGIGIPPLQLETIFDIFSKLPNENSTGRGGIGLAHCRKIVRNHGGTISVQSEPGSGSTFCVTLPISA